MSVSLEFPRRSDRRQISGSRSPRGSSGPIARAVEGCLLTKQIAQPACGTVARSAVRRGSAPDPAPVQRGRAERHSPLFRVRRWKGPLDLSQSRLTLLASPMALPRAASPARTSRTRSPLFRWTPPGRLPRDPRHTLAAVSRGSSRRLLTGLGEPLRGGRIAVAIGLSRRTPGPPAATKGCSPPLGSPASADGVALTDGRDHPFVRQHDWWQARQFRCQPHRHGDCRAHAEADRGAVNQRRVGMVIQPGMAGAALAARVL